jgi:hypothetical protein
VKLCILEFDRTEINDFSSTLLHGNHGASRDDKASLQTQPWTPAVIMSDSELSFRKHLSCVAIVNSSLFHNFVYLNPTYPISDASTPTNQVAQSGNLFL